MSARSYVLSWGSTSPTCITHLLCHTLRLCRPCALVSAHQRGVRLIQHQQDAVTLLQAAEALHQVKKVVWRSVSVCIVGRPGGNPNPGTPYSTFKSAKSPSMLNRLSRRGELNCMK